MSNDPIGFHLNRGQRDIYHRALAGQLPADVLPTHLRWVLIASLHRKGWSDVAIATHTLLSTYTVGRIREGLGLRPNRPLDRYRAEERSARCPRA